MKRWIALPCVWAISVAVQAAPVGLGATVRAESATVYVPIEVSDSLRLEPFASYQKRHVVASGSTADTTDESKLLEGARCLQSRNRR